MYIPAAGTFVFEEAYDEGYANLGPLSITDRTQVCRMLWKFEYTSILRAPVQ